MSEVSSNGSKSKKAQESGTEIGGDPILIEVTRGEMMESRHHATFAVSDSEGRIVLSAGEIERPVYARSSLKPIQAIPLVETGAAAAFGLGDAEIALACASHNGEARHFNTVRAWLSKIGLSESDLECGPHLPYHEETAHDMIRRNEDPSQLHNNCSGKHSGFLSVAKHLGYPTKGYIRLEHPVQQRILGLLETMTGLDLSNAPKGIDGCGIPVIGIPLGNLALAMARFADPSDQPEARQDAIKRIRSAMAAEPFMVAGSGRYCTRVMAETKGRALIKAGAEGFFCGALPELGLGIALKIDDGATRAAENLMTRILHRLDVIDEETLAKVSAPLTMPVRNRAGREIGLIRAPAHCPF
ncbi:MAG: asparaginase [Kiloniellales bacterium]|nr:asparaginase [Kiloniellales bacterium]